MVLFAATWVVEPIQSLGLDVGSGVESHLQQSQPDERKSLVCVDKEVHPYSALVSDRCWPGDCAAKGAEVISGRTFGGIKVPPYGGQAVALEVGPLQSATGGLIHVLSQAFLVREELAEVLAAGSAAQDAHSQLRLRVVLLGVNEVLHEAFAVLQAVQDEDQRVALANMFDQVPC